MTVKQTWQIRVKNGSECIASVTVPEYTSINVSPIYKRCDGSKITLKWDGEIAMGKPSCREFVWHRTRNMIPIKDGRYLICTKESEYFVMADADTKFTNECGATVIWSRWIRGICERIPAANIHWWAEIPLPSDESWEATGSSLRMGKVA